MPTYLVEPPPFELRMAFMDALEASRIDYSREAEGYLVYLRDDQRDDVGAHPRVLPRRGAGRGPADAVGVTLLAILSLDGRGLR